MSVERVKGLRELKVKGHMMSVERPVKPERSVIFTVAVCIC